MGFSNPFRQRIVALIVQYTKFILTLYISQSFSWHFRLKHSRDKGSAFPLNSLNDTLIVFDPYANDGGTVEKHTVG